MSDLIASWRMPVQRPARAELVNGNERAGREIAPAVGADLQVDVASTSTDAQVAEFAGMCKDAGETLVHLLL